MWKEEICRWQWVVGWCPIRSIRSACPCPGPGPFLLLIPSLPTPSRTLAHKPKKRNAKPTLPPPLCTVLQKGYQDAVTTCLRGPTTRLHRDAGSNRQFAVPAVPEQCATAPLSTADGVLQVHSRRKVPKPKIRESHSGAAKPMGMEYD